MSKWVASCHLLTNFIFSVFASFYINNLCPFFSQLKITATLRELSQSGTTNGDNFGGQNVHWNVIYRYIFTLCEFSKPFAENTKFVCRRSRGDKTNMRFP